MEVAMFWIICALAVLLLFAIAWFSSGFVTKPDTMNFARGDIAAKSLGPKVHRL
ncbi:MAG TPA: hypothetical protein VIL10_06440 [Marmoricola sp.]